MTDSSPKPVGYWAKQLDRLITDRFDRLITDVGITRRDWQILNLLAVRPNTRDGIERELAPFAHDGQTPIALTRLIDNGRVASTSGGLTLTESGRRAHSELTDRVGRIRDRTVHGIDDDRYRVTVATLAQMCANLE